MNLPPGSRFRAAALMLVLALSFGAVPAAAAPAAGDEPRAGAGAPRQAHSIAVFRAPEESDLRSLGVSIWDRGDSLLVVSLDDATLDLLAVRRIVPIARVRDLGQWIYILSRTDGFVPPQITAADGVTVIPLAGSEDLYLYPRDREVVLPRVRPMAGLRAVPRIPLAPLEAHAADRPGLPEEGEGAGSLLFGETADSVLGLAGRGADSRERAGAPAPLAVNPLVTQIVNGTSQAGWFQFVRDLSGDSTVTIAGVTRTISTRYSNAMYPVPQNNALATEYILEKAAGWGYTGVRESYTSANSGCGSQSVAWQNIIFTLPGQVDYGAHQQVIFVTHHDSLSYNSTENLNYAPGADDAISGGSALLEALRLFKGYGFRNTVKIIFFSGEEEGLCGSVAYTRMHPASDMWRVVNMDQTAYDGNKNGLMDCYNWSLASSPQSVALGDAFVQANGDYGPIIDPAKVVRDTTKMCQTDHCPFWNVGVAAIALVEDLHNGDICPCFDQSQTATCHDTVTQIDPNHPGQLMFDQNYSWPTEKAAIATVASLAEPLYACPASAPAPVVTPGNNILHVAWPTAAGVTNYVLERASSCGGTFTPLISTTGTAYEDTDVTNGASYAYRVRTCPTQTSACVAASPLPGPSVIYQAGSAVVTADSGDHDNVADNCELVTVQLNVVNDGNTPLTGVKLTGISSSHPGVQVASAVPQSLGSLGVGASAPAGFAFYLGRNGSSAVCAESIPFTVTTSSDQSPSGARSFSLTAEQDNAPGPLTYGFELDFSGWTVATGSFTRVAGGAPGSTGFSLHSRNINNDCDAIVSPVIVPTASTSMTMWINYSIETPTIYDRAVVRVVDPATGVKTLITPTAGAPYTTTGTASTLCDTIGLLQGWAGSLTTWTQTTFSLASFAGTPIQIEVRFSTDGSALGTQGFWFDQVAITNATQIACDAQSNTCPALPSEVSPAGAPVPFTIAKNGASYDLRFSEAAGATQYEIYAGTLASLHGGLYDHAAAGGVCGVTDGAPGDGQVTASVPDATFAGGTYLLAVARNGAGESQYGTTSAGAAIPLSLARCP